MRRILALAGKDLLETRRDRLSAIFIVVMPLAFTAFFGVLFAGGSERLPLWVHDADGGERAAELIVALEDSDVVRLSTASLAELERAVADGEAPAGLVLPSGYSAAVDAGEPAGLILISRTGSSAAAAIASAVRSAATRQVALEHAARVAVEAAGADSDGTGQSGGEDESDAASREAVPPYAEALRVARTAAAASLDQPAARSRVEMAGAAAGQIPSGFVLSSPGMLINFVLFSLTTAGVALIVERRNGTLQRLMTTRVRRFELIAGKTIGMFGLTFFQQVLLIGVGQLLFGVDYLRDPAALLLMMVATSLVASTLGLLLATLLGSEQALIAATVIVSMSVAALSGAWFPLEVVGSGFAAVGRLLPTAWILDGLRGIIVRGFGPSEVLPAFGVALAWSAVLFGLAVWRFRLSD
jgi:ABC-2 type transport system permease protein